MDSFTPNPSLPSFWSSIVICAVLLPMVAGMLFGGTKGRPKEEIWLFRGAGVEIAFILLPFLFYAIGNILNGTYSKFMASPELPMAAMILFLLTIFSMLKGLAVGAKRGIAVESFIVLTFLATAFAFACAAYISWLAYHQDVSLWFGVGNSVLIVVAVGFSFALHAAMLHLMKFPEQFGKDANTDVADSYDSAGDSRAE